MVRVNFDFMCQDRQKQMRPFLRVLAAGWLSVWLGALGVCSTEALCDLPHDGGSDEDGVQHAEHHDDSSHHGCTDNPFCQSLKSTGLSQPLAKLVKPDFHPLDFLPQRCELSLQLLPKPAIFRQPPDRILPFTPELSLGPAFRSLAPPVIS